MVEWPKLKTPAPSFMVVMALSSALLLLCNCSTSIPKYTADAVAKKYVTDVTLEKTRPIEKQLDLLVTLTEDGLTRVREADRRIDTLTANIHDGFKEVAKHNKKVLIKIKILKRHLQKNTKRINAITKKKRRRPKGGKT